MKERPILFSAPMVRAILDGRKTQTRRAVKLGDGWKVDAFAFDPSRTPPWRMGVYVEGNGADVGGIKSPYGVPGDQLWVREEHFRFGHWERKSKPSKKTGRYGYRFVADSNETRFGKPEGARLSPPRTDDERERPQWYKRLARFMPRTSSRTLLEVVSVRVERLHDITEEDAEAEGVEGFEPGDGELLDSALPFNSGSGWKHYEPQVDSSYNLNARDSFAELWRSINGADSWAENPWVWVVEFGG